MKKEYFTDNKRLVTDFFFKNKNRHYTIDGVFDELALIGVDAQTSRQVSDYYEEWNSYKEGGNE